MDVYYPDSISYPNGNTVQRERYIFLLSLKKPYTAEQVSAKLHSHSISLKDSLSKNPINNTRKRFWITTGSNQWTIYDVIGTVGQIFAQDYDWIGPAYTNPNTQGEKGVFCPLPNVLVITFKSKTNMSGSIYDDLQNQYSMTAIVEKSKYYEENTDYFIITDLRRNTSYKIKNILESQTDMFTSIRFENIPMIVPITAIPNDTEYNRQWNMQKILAGGRISTPPNPPDNGTTTWDLTTGSGDIVICVMDSGCDLTHPDLKFFNNGINLETMKPDGSPIDPPAATDTDAGHGTAVAGIIAATNNNSLGVAGVAGGCKILPLAFENWSSEELIRGINFARISNVRVINMSFHLNFPDATAVDAALQLASERLLICAAAGNENENSVNYPANSPFVMACGASNQVDKRKTPTPADDWGSNFGPELSVMAPGTIIPTTDIVGDGGYNKDGDYTFSFAGTSAAVPHLSGLAGLIYTVYPTINPEEARNIIERTADKVGSVTYGVDSNHPNGTWNNEMGYGRINTLRAIIAASAFNPELPWFREVEIDGSMILHDYENIKDDEEKTSLFHDGLTITYQLGPFQPPVELPVWIDTVGGEIRGEVRLSMHWKTDSSIDIKYNIKLYEGTSIDTTDLDGEESGILNVPKDRSIDLDKRVTNTDEREPRDFINLNLHISNKKRS